MANYPKPATILIVDNDPDVLGILSQFLSQEGFAVRTAPDPASAQALLDRERIDLIILDIRLVDDEDDKDMSGLALAQAITPDIPKLILTRFPTYQAVRAALGPSLDGLPPAVGFIAKQEGLAALLRSVRLALLQLHPSLEASLLRAFQAPARLALPGRMQELGPEEASRRLQLSFEDTTAELTQYRERENRRAAEYHLAGLIAAGLAMLIVVASAILGWTGRLDIVHLPLLVSALAEATSLLFFGREDAAHRRVLGYFGQLNELNRLGNLLIACDSLESEADRAAYKKKVINRLIDRWLSDETPVSRRSSLARSSRHVSSKNPAGR